MEDERQGCGDDSRREGNKMLRLDAGQIEVVDDAVAEILRNKTSEERLKIASGMWRSARNQLFASLGSLHPDWTKERIEQEVIRRLSHGAA